MGAGHSEPKTAKTVTGTTPQNGSALTQVGLILTAALVIVILVVLLIGTMLAISVRPTVSR